MKITVAQLATDKSKLFTSKGAVRGGEVVDLPAAEAKGLVERGLAEKQGKQSEADSSQ